MTLTEYTNNVKNAMDIVRLFSHQFSWLEQLNLISNTILLENKDVQKLIIEQLVFKFCGFQPRFMRNGLRQAALDLGIYTTLEKNPVYIAPVKVNIEYVTNCSQEYIDEIIKELNTISLFNSEQYADRLTKSDHKNLARRNLLTNKLRNLGVSELRKIYPHLKDAYNKEQIELYAKYQK